MTKETVLTGLDGANPIGYLAALGVLRAMHDSGRSIRLKWKQEDVWRPVLYDLQREELLQTLSEDVERWRNRSPELELRYSKVTKKKTIEIAEIKPPPSLFQEFATKAADECRRGDRRWADYVASFGAAHEMLGTDNNGATKPTALHFTAGNQLFLQMVRSILETVQSEHIEEAIFGPWLYRGTAPVLNWDIVAGERSYALRATNPSGPKKLGVPGADWLAFRGMSAFPVVLRAGKAATTAFEGSGKNYCFHWALWSRFLDYFTVKSVVCTRWDGRSDSERRARGIALVLASQVGRTEQGGYGSFRAPGPR